MILLTSKSSRNSPLLDMNVFQNNKNTSGSAQYSKTDGVVLGEGPPGANFAGDGYKWTVSRVANDIQENEGKAQ